jgi:hypothetical protein
MSIIPFHRDRTKFVDELAEYREQITPKVVETVEAPRRLHHEPDSTRRMLAELRAEDAPQIRVCPWPRRHRTEPTAAERLAGIGLLYATRHPSVQTGAEL